MTDTGPAPRHWVVYMLRCGDDSLYTGITTDLARRIGEHRGAGGRGARSLRGRGPLEVVFRVEAEDRGLALRLEHRIKQLTRRDKEALVARQPTGAALRQSLGLAGVVCATPGRATSCR